MADRDYNLNYRANSSGFLGPSNVVVRVLMLINTLIDKLIPKMQGMYAPLARSAGSATKNNQQLATALNAVASGASNAATAASVLQAALGRTAGSGRRTSSILAGMGPAAALGVAAAAAAGEALGEAYEKARDYARDVAQENLKILDQLREFAALKGDAGPGEKHVAGLADLMLRSGASAAEAVPFMTMWESTIPAARKTVDEKGEKNWQLTPDQESELMQRTLQFATQKGVSPQIMGTMVASLGINEKITGVDQAMKKVGAIHAMGNEAVGFINEVFKAESGLRASFVKPGGGGPARSSEELSAMLAASTTVNKAPFQAARSMDQVYRESQKAAGTKAGITRDMNFVDILGKFKEIIDQGRARGLSEQQALRAAGFNAPSANKAIIQEVSVLDLYRKNVEQARKGGDPAQMKKDAAAYQASPAGGARLAASAQEVARLRRGEEMAELEVMRGFAKAGGDLNRTLNTTITNLAEGIIDMNLPMVGSLSQKMGLQPAQERHVDEIVAQMVQKVAPAAIGATPSGAMGGLPHDAELAAAIRTLTPEQRAKLGQMMREYATTRGSAPAADVGGAGGLLGRSLLEKVNPAGLVPHFLGPEGADILPRAAPGPMAPGPQASAASAAPWGQLLSMNQAQVNELSAIRRATGGRAVPQGGAGDLPSAMTAIDDGARRVG